MGGSPINRRPQPHLEAKSRLVSLLSVSEHELASLETLADARLATIIERIRIFHQDLHEAIDALGDEPDDVKRPL